MKKLIITLLSLISGSVVFSQYTYFNNVYQDVPENAAVSTGIFCLENRHVSFSVIADGAFYFQFRELNDLGDIIYDHNFPVLDTSIYLGLSHGLEVYTDGIALAGTFATANNSAIGAAQWFSTETFEPIWSHTFNEINDSSNISLFTCLRKMNDATFYVGGTRLTYLDADTWIDEFSTYIAHLDENGSTMNDWIFVEDNQYYQIEEIFELENGKLLISGTRAIFEIKDHFLRLFNPTSGEIEEEVVWGSQWNESANKLRKMSNGDYYMIYDSISSSDGEIELPLQQKSCWLKRIDPNNLSTLWQTEIPLNDLDVLCKEFAINGFEQTLDNGYVFCYLYAPEDLTQGWYQPHLVKLNSNFEVEWVKEYTITDEYQIKWILDIDIACDGGFICTGFALVPAFGTIQRQWTFKTDACGEIVQSNCPAVAITEKHKTTTGIFPNPTASSTTLRFGEYRNHVGIIQILDMTGRLVATFNKYDNGQDYFLNMEQLPVGAYSIQLLKQNGEFLEAFQIVKQ